MRQHIVRVHLNGRMTEFRAKEGTNLLEFLHSNFLDIPSPCGGKGKCGKCRVKVKGISSEAAKTDRDLLGKHALEQGYRLACSIDIESDLDIYVDEEEPQKASILTSGKSRPIPFAPSVIKKHHDLHPPSLEDQAPDLERVYKAMGSSPKCPVELLRSLPGILREKDFSITTVVFDDLLITVEPGDTSARTFGVAVDIGTTTIAAYLCDLNSGKRLGVASSLNPQRKFGADVLSRIGYASINRNNKKEMHKCLIDGINALILEMCKKYGARNDEVYQAVFVGNTTMVHFLQNLPAGNIAVSPFIPVSTDLGVYDVSELGIKIHRHGRAVVYPCVSGYIGADTVAAILSSGMHEDGHNSLLIDIGTNGEIVLGGMNRLYSCSTAAGPAFEGANIRHGIGGVAGAIDKVFFGKKLEYTTIGDEESIGVCGSGVVDAISVMLRYGIVDETGRILDSGECAGVPEELAERLTEEDGMKAFLLAEREIGEDIVITQKDIRELQNAKAAIAAGIYTLAKKAGINLDSINRVYLAGGFGNHINVESAVNIGLIPRILKDRVDAIGNAAGEGAAGGLISRHMIEQAAEISRRVEYIELSGSDEFVNEYVDNMWFPQQGVNAV